MAWRRVPTLTKKGHCLEGSCSGQFSKGQEYVPSIARSPKFQKKPGTLSVYDSSQLFDAHN